jgi:pimeloyl-ACP methyl ester carboxylesterase
MTTTYVLIHGGGDTASSWDLVAKDLRDRGSDVVAVDLPIEDRSAGWSAYADAVVEATGERSDVVVVAHSLGGFTAPLVCTRMPVGLLVLVAAMAPVPGERAIDYWANAGYEEGSDGDEVDVFFHDVPPELALQAMRAGRDQAIRRCTSPGRSTRGRPSRRATCCAVTTGCSRPR